MKKLEKEIEAAAVRYAECHGCKALKLIDRGRKGFPDRSFFLPGGKLFLVEFKRPKEKPTQVQLEYHAALIDLGFDVWLCEGLEQFKKIFHRYVPIP